MSGQENNSNDRNFNSNNRNSKQLRWMPFASVTPANSDPNWENPKLRRDVHLQLNASEPKPNGQRFFSCSFSRVVRPAEFDSEGNTLAPPVTNPFFGIMTEIVEGRVVPTAGTMQRAEDIRDMYLDAVHQACEEGQAQFEAHLLAMDERQNRSDRISGVAARSTQRVMRKGKTARKRGGVVLDAPPQDQGQDNQPESREEQQD